MTQGQDYKVYQICNVLKWKAFVYAPEHEVYIELGDFFHAEKERTSCKYNEQIHKMTTVFTQHCPRLSL